MQKHYLLLILSVFLSACANKQPISNNTISVDITTVHPMNLADMVKHISLIPLETTDSCLIKNIDQMQIQNNKLYINNARQEVMVFDMNGTFLQSTHPMQGEGTEKYISAVSMDIDQNEIINIYDFFTHQTKEYNNLQFIKSTILNIPDSTTSAQEWRTHRKINDEVYLIKDYRYIYFYSAKQDKLLNSIYEKDIPFIGQTSSLRLPRYDGKIYFSPSYPCDTLYWVNEKEYKMAPAVIFNFGQEGLNLKEIPKEMPIDYYMNFIQNTDKVVPMDKIHLSSADFCFFLKNMKFHVAYRNKEGKTTVYQSGDKIFPIPNAIDNNKFYCAVQTDELDKFIDPILMTKKEYEHIKTLKYDDNPVIVCYELK